MVKRIILNTFMVIATLAHTITGFAQKQISLDNKPYVKYDNRWFTPSAKFVSEISLSLIFSIDDEPLFRDLAPGNIIDTGYNYGIGIDYINALCTNENVGFYGGVGYEIYPNKYQKAKLMFGYRSPVFWGYVDFFSKYEFVYGWDLHSKMTENQFRIYFVNIRYKQFNAYWGIQTWDEWFDDGFYLIQVNYLIRPRKW